jgi:anaerobic selenocysteine-containing dehydrogenase
MNARYNSGGHTVVSLHDASPTNPAYVHPDDLADLGVHAGDVVSVRSARAAILAVAEPDPTLRRGVVSMSHAWGDLEELDAKVREIGGCTARLIANDDVWDPYSGQPQMSNIPVAVTLHERAGAPA